MFRKIRLLAVPALLTCLVPGDAKADSLSLVPDFSRSFANEKLHVLHLAAVAKVDWVRMSLKARTQALAELNYNLNVKGCAMLKQSGEKFAFVKVPSGALETQVVDIHRKLIGLHSLPWKNCR